MNGVQIVDSLLTNIKARGGETTMLIATKLGEPVYEKFGFRKVYYYVFKRDSTKIDKRLTNKIQPYRNAFYNDIIQA